MKHCVRIIPVSSTLLGDMTRKNYYLSTLVKFCYVHFDIGKRAVGLGLSEAIFKDIGPEFQIFGLMQVGLNPISCTLSSFEMQILEYYLYS